MRPLNGWFSVTFTCTYAPDSPQDKWSTAGDYAGLVPRPNAPTHPPGWYDANDLHGAARLAIFGIWSHIGNPYDFREKAADGQGVTGFELTYTLSREVTGGAYPWSKNLVKTLAVLDSSMGVGGCVFERAPVLPDMLKDIRARRNTP